MKNIKKGLMNMFDVKKSEKSESNVEEEKEPIITEVKEELNTKPDRNLKWYQRFGLEQDPFDHRNLSPKVLGHEEEKRQITEWIKDGRSILVYGTTGVGKTNLINEIIQELNDNKIEGLKNFGTMYHSFDVPGNPQHMKKFKKAKGFFGFGKKSIAAFMDEIHFGDEKDVIGISALWDRKDIHSAVFIQINKKPKLDQLVRRIGIYNVELKPISKNIIFDIIKQRSDNKPIFNDEAMDAIVKLGGENPSIVLQLCGEIASYLADPQKPVGLEDVKGFRFSDIEGMSKEALKAVMSTDSLNEKARKKAKCSPVEWEIVKNLRTGDMTISEIAKSLEKNETKLNTPISRMLKKNQIKIVKNKKPKVYGLEPEFEREFVLING